MIIKAVPLIMGFRLDHLASSRLAGLVSVVTSLTLGLPSGVAANPRPNFNFQVNRQVNSQVNSQSQKVDLLLQPSYLLVQPQVPRPTLAPHVLYVFPIKPAEVVLEPLPSPYTNQLPYQFPNQLQQLSPQYFIPSPGISGFKPIQP